MSDNTGTSVGVITLDLRIVSKLNEQLNAIAATANKSAQQSFNDVGKTVERAISKPVENAGKAMEKAITAPIEKVNDAVKAPLKKTTEQFEQSADEIADIAERAAKRWHDSLQPKDPKDVNLPKTAQLTGQSEPLVDPQKYMANLNEKNSSPDLDSIYKPAADTAELLRKKIQSLNSQFDIERQKLGELNAAFSQATAGSKAWDDLNNKVEISKKRLISLQESMNATQAKIDEPAKKAAAAAEKAAAAQIKAQEKAAKSAQKAAAKTAQVQERETARLQAAAQRASTRISSATKPMKKAVGGLGRSIKRAFKSTFIMAGVYAAFRGLRSLMGEASAQNKQFATSLNAIKANLTVAFTPIYQAILPALNALMSGLATATKNIAAFISALFGKTYAQSVATTKKMQSNAAAAKKAKSGKGAKNGDKGSLAGFDEVNVIGKKDSDSGGSDTGGANFDALDMKGTEAAAGLAAKFKTAWEGIASGFNDYVINPIQDNLSKFDAPIARFKSLFADIGIQCREWLTPLTDWFQTDFKSALSQAISDGSTILAGFMDSLAMVATTIWNAWKPVIDWLVKNGLPLLTDIFKELSKTTVTWFEATKTVFDTLWTGVMEPLYQLVSKMIVDIMSTFKSLWEQYGVTTFENIRTTINSIKDTFLNVWNSFLKPIFDQLFLTLNQLWTDHLQPLVYQIGVFVAALVNGAMEIFNKFIAPMVNWFVKTWGPPIAGAINNVIKMVGSIVANIADAAKNIFKSLNGIIDFLVGVFTGNWSKAWNGVKEIFRGVFNALYEIAKAPINGIIGMLNGLICGINEVIKGLNKIHIDIPATKFTPEFSFGVSIPTIDKIPYLANGGILTQPTLAMMGEYAGAKNNPEIAAPQSLLMDTFMETMVPLLNEMAEFREDVVQLLREIIAKNPNIIMDGTTLSRLIKPYLDEENKRVGGTIFNA